MTYRVTKTTIVKYTIVETVLGYRKRLYQAGVLARKHGAKAELKRASSVHWYIYDGFGQPNFSINLEK